MNSDMFGKNLVNFMYSLNLKNPIAEDDDEEVYTRELPLHTQGFVNLDLTDNENLDKTTLLFSPDGIFDGSPSTDYDFNTKLDKSSVKQYYTNIEFPEKLIGFSLKEELKFIRHDTDIISCWLESIDSIENEDRVKEEKIVGLAEAIIAALEAIADYTDQLVAPNAGAPATPMNTFLTPAIIQEVKDALSAYTEQDGVYRKKIDANNVNIKKFIDVKEEEEE